MRKSMTQKLREAKEEIDILRATVNELESDRKILRDRHVDLFKQICKTPTGSYNAEGLILHMSKTFGMAKNWWW